MIRCGRPGLKADPVQALPGFGLGEHLHHGRVELLHDGLGRAGRNHQAVPHVEVHVLDAALLDRGHPGGVEVPLVAGDADGAQGAGSHMGHRIAGRQEGHLHLVAQQRCDDLRCTCVGNVGEARACRDIEAFSRDVGG
ncbi:hypothetical protein D3C87_1647420 [compost metagenome]